MTQPLTVTSPGHAVARAGYGMAWVLGIAYMTGWAEATSLEELTGKVFVGIWSICLGAAGAWGVLSIRAATYSKGSAKPLLGAMRDEAWSAAGIAVALLGYEVVILRNLGLFDGAATQILVTGIGLGCAFRVRQIRSEIRDVRASLDNPVAADPAPLGRPDADEE
ncbi:hypothetical protein [Serinicoccus sediminis]|uniref:hypothetical protein n=1 Tax=Serinicoccus sediminis TaxID=2306021 RepID=UPI001022276C|nr:hypothetical protein [Serinicoccus sediminis]